MHQDGSDSPDTQLRPGSRTAFDYSLPLIPGLVRFNGRWLRDKPAFISPTNSQTWGEFDAATNRVANGLLSEGLVPGDRLALLMHNSIEMIQLIFGAMKARICVVPLNLSVSDAAASAMISDCTASVLAASHDQCARFDRLPDRSAMAVRLKLGLGAPDNTWSEYSTWLLHQSSQPPNCKVSPDDECNIIYSSGTTSLPKGIVHSHRCRYDTAFDLAVALRYHSGATILSSLGLYSNISWIALLCNALCGATLTLMPEFSPTALAEHIEAYRVTHGVFVPVQLQRLLELEAVAHRDFSSLETITVLGSPFAPTLKKATRDLLGCELIELYGLTEGLVTTLAPEDFERKLASVGKPLPGIELKLIDEFDQEVPVGEPGEIVGTSRFLMDGYLNRPEATREAMWMTPDGQRWLRTGDIGRLDNEGFLYIVDRKKDMILSGGQNIYPADIEAVILKHSDVAEAAVIGVRSDRWGETPVAVVVPRDDTSIDPQELTEWVNIRLGKQQRISNILVRATLPRNANGKVLKRALRDEYDHV